MDLHVNPCLVMSKEKRVPPVRRIFTDEKSFANIRYAARRAGIFQTDRSRKIKKEQMIACK